MIFKKEEYKSKKKKIFLGGGGVRRGGEGVGWLRGAGIGDFFYFIIFFGLGEGVLD